MEPEKAYQLVRTIKKMRVDNNAACIPFSGYQDLIEEFGIISLDAVNEIWKSFDVAVAVLFRKRKARYTQGYSISE